MKVSFPHMGNTYIPLKALIESLGFQVILPDRPSRRSLELGAKYAPEFVCLPFKLNLGDLICALEKGADTLVMVQGSYPCRFGYYGRVQHDILRDLGYKFKSVLLDRGSTRDFPFFKLLQAFRIFRKKSKILDRIESLARKIRPYEVRKGETTKVYNECLTRLEKAKDIREIKRVEDEALALFKGIKKEGSRQPLKVGLLGEIYLVIEPAVNFDLERKLGEWGIEVDPALTVHKWVMRPIKVDLKILMDERRARRIAKPYLAYPLGGEEHQTIARTIMAAKSGYDGVIHIFPFTCMPENLTRMILPKISKDYNIPVLNLSIDVHTSEAGIISRLEAFIDLLEKRRKNRQQTQDHRLWSNLWA